MFVEHDANGSGMRLKQFALLVLGLVPAIILSVLGSISFIFGPNWPALVVLAGIVGTIGLGIALFGSDSRMKYGLAGMLVLGELSMSTLLVPFLQGLDNLPGWAVAAIGWFTCGPAISGLVLMNDVLCEKHVH